MARLFTLSQVTRSKSVCLKMLSKSMRFSIMTARDTSTIKKIIYLNVNKPDLCWAKLIEEGDC